MATAEDVADAPSPTARLSAIAVLPFADMSPGRDQDYLCEGLAEELINALTHIDGLRVSARTASFQFRGAGADFERSAASSVLERCSKAACASRRSPARDGSAHRSRDGLSPVVSAFRSHARRRVCHPGRIAESVATSLRGSVLSGREKQALQRPQTGAAAYGSCLAAAAPAAHDAVRPRAKRRDVRARHRAGCRLRSRLRRLAMVHATLYEWFGAREGDLPSQNAPA